MDKQNLMPQPAQHVKWIATRRLPPKLAGLLEEALQLKLQGETCRASMPGGKSIDRDCEALGLPQGKGISNPIDN